MTSGTVILCVLICTEYCSAHCYVLSLRNCIQPCYSVLKTVRSRRQSLGFGSGVQESHWKVTLQRVRIPRLRYVMAFSITAIHPPALGVLLWDAPHIDVTFPAHESCEVIPRREILGGKVTRESIMRSPISRVCFFSKV
jgi:hypothetical protein